MKTFGITFYTILLYHTIFIDPSWWLGITLFLINPFWEDLRRWYITNKKTKDIEREVNEEVKTIIENETE